MDGLKCYICNEIKQPTKEIKVPCTPCDLCRNPICIECSKLTASEVKCLPLKTRLLKFYCPKCRDYEIVVTLQNTIKDKEQIIKDKDDIIKLLEQKIRDIESIPKPQTTYANILHGQTAKKVTSATSVPNIIIKPKNTQDKEKAKNDVLKDLHPAKLQIGIKALKSTNKGCCIVACPTKEDVNKLITEAKRILNDNYTVELSKLRNPRIKIVGCPSDMEPKEIEDCLKQQNNVPADTLCKVVYIRKSRRNPNQGVTAFVECTSESFHKIMSKGKVYIGWQRLPVYEDLEISRCFKCQSFDHKQNQCTKSVTCPYCAGEHELTACDKQRKACINCILANKKYRLNLDENHESTDTNCPTVKYHLQNLRNRTDYGHYHNSSID